MMSRYEKTLNQHNSDQSSADHSYKISRGRQLVNRNRRRAQMRKVRNMQIFVVTVILCILAVSLTSFVSRAASKDNVTYFKYYSNIEVNAGDTLVDIAAMYADHIHYESIQEYIDEVVYMNHLADADSIHAGTHIIVPYYSDEFKK